jgi:hypothetical protein
MNIQINNNILHKFINFTFDIEFNDMNLKKTNFNKKIIPLNNLFMEIDNFYETNNLNKEDYKNIQGFIYNKIYDKFIDELKDEIDLISIYENKIKKYIKNNKELDIKNICDDIKNIIEKPLEGEITKHDKKKIITTKIMLIDNSIDVKFYLKYNKCDGYNKQTINLINKFIKNFIV